MSLTSRPGRCWYCGSDRLLVGDPLEHIIPSAIGGELTTDRVCNSYNQKVATLDQQFVQDWRVIQRRQQFSIRDRQGRLPPNPRGVKVILPDGSPGRVEMTGGKFEPQPAVRVERVDERTIRVVAANEGEARRKVESLRAELEAKGYELTIGEPVRAQVPHGEVKVHVKVRQGVMMRMFAKLILGTASLLWPDEWLDTGTAQILQRNVDGEDLPRDAEGVLAEPPGHDEKLLKAAIPEPMHFLCLKSFGNDRAAFIAVLFGATFWVTGLEDVGPQVDRGWLLDPVARSIEETDFGGLSLRAVEALRANRTRGGR